MAALAGSRGYSEHTQWLVDQEVAALLTQAETRARDLLTSHRQALARLTAALLEQETVTGDQVRAIAWAATGLTGKLTAVMDIHGDQVAYNGHLLYTFADDQPGQVTGQVTGQAVQGFFVATPALAPITGSATAGSPATAGPAPAAPSGNPYGY